MATITRRTALKSGVGTSAYLASATALLPDLGQAAQTNTTASVSTAGVNTQNLTPNTTPTNAFAEASFPNDQGSVVTRSLANGRIGVATVTPPALLVGATQPKFVNLMPNPLASGNRFAPNTANGYSYTLRLREFNAQIGLYDAANRPLSTVLWGYATPTQTATSPGRTFEVIQNIGISVTYLNELVDPATKTALQHRLPVDSTLMWANPGNLGGQAPVPWVAHRHGGAQTTDSDGLPDAWATPDVNKDGVPDYRGRLWSRPYVYPNTQESGHLWYHDHALGVTRLNVFMGLAGHYFIRDINELLMMLFQQLPSRHELPMVIQDRMFTATGQLYYPATDPTNPSAPAVTHLPEFFGDVILVNGTPWPYYPVQQRYYRLRLLNGSDSRFYDLRFQLPNGAAIYFHQIGTDVGFLNSPVQLTHLLLAPGERADVLIDFKQVPFGSQVTVVNSAATPYPAKPTGTTPPDPKSTALIARFLVNQPRSAQPDITLPTKLRTWSPPLPTVSTTGASVRKLMLFEGTDPFGRLQTMLGTVNPAPGNPISPAHGTFFYSDPVTEKVKLNSTEVWEIYNTTVDAHPIHLHGVVFRILNRQGFSGTTVPKPMGAGGRTQGGWLTQVALTGAARAPAANEAGGKDTVVCYPGEVTRIVTKFSAAGEYVWHCHILSHEDHEMMRRFTVA